MLQYRFMAKDVDRLRDLRGERRSSEAGERDGVALRLLLSGPPGLRPKLVFSVSFPTKTPRARSYFVL